MSNNNDIKSLNVPITTFQVRRNEDVVTLLTSGQEGASGTKNKACLCYKGIVRLLFSRMCNK